MRPVATVLSTLATGAVAVALVGVAVAPPAVAAGVAHTWRGAGDGVSWTDPANWTPATVPGTGDSVVVQAYDDGSCHAHVTGVPSGLQLADLTVDERLFGGDPDSPCLTSLDGGSITVTHRFTFHAGTIGTAVTIASGATGVVTPGAAHDTTHFTGAVTVAGGLTLASLTDPENLSLTGGPGITVAAGGALTTEGDNHVSADCCLDPAHLTNNGTVQLGPGTLALDAVQLDQNAVVDATGGGQVVTTVAPQTAGPGARWTGNGSWQLGRSSVTTVSGTQTLGKGFHWRLGGNGSTASETLQGRFVLAGTGTVDWGGGLIAANVVIGPTVRFLADGPDGADPRRIDGRDRFDNPVVITARGAMTFSGGAGWHGVDGARITVASTSTLTLGAGTSVTADCCNLPSTIVNLGGTVLVPGGAGTVTVDDTGYRATGGTLAVGSGSDLELTGGAAGWLRTTTVSGGGTVGIAQPMSTEGTETVGDATTLALEANGALTTTERQVTTISGTGSFAWTGGSVAGALTVSTAGGQTVSGTTTAKNILAATGGRASAVTFTGPTTIAAGAAGAPNTVSAAAVSKLRFTGSLTWRGNTVVTGAAITTSGTTTVLAGAGQAGVTGSGGLTNTGSLTVRTGTLGSDHDVVQTAGTTTVAAGATIAVTQPYELRIDGGALTGTGRVVGDLGVGAATFAPGVTGTPGTFTVTGYLTTTTAATIQLELTATAFDQVVVGQVASLRGALRLVDLDGYQPATGDTVTVMTTGGTALHLACTTTTGAGAATQHWVAQVVQNAKLVQLVSRPGPPASC